jgi:F-type H+-transporting ATPase subunit a
MIHLLNTAAETAAHGAEAAEHSGGGTHDAGTIMQHLIEHVYDHPVISIPWKPFGIDISITKLTIMMWLAGALIFIIFRSLAVKQRTSGARGRFVNFFEPFVVYVRDEMVYPLMGKERGKRYLPLFLTQFFFLLFCNLLGMIPYMSSATGNMAVCATLAFTTLFTILVMGMTEQGVGKFFKTLVPHGVPKLLYPVLFPLELLGIFIKCFALTIRLFANITGGHIVILTFIGLIFVARNYWVAIPSLSFVLFISMLELFVAFLQAFIFVMLSIIFVNMAIQPEH